MGRIVDIAVKKFVAAGPTPSISPVLAGVGTITVLAKAGLTDGDYFTIDDGINTAVIFEYDVTGDGVTALRTAIDISAVSTLAEVKAATLAAINGVGALLAVTASSGGAGVVNLQMDTPGPGVTTTENVADAGFLVTGLAEPNPAQTWGFKLVGIRSTDSTTSTAGTEGTVATGPLEASALDTLVVTWTDVATWAAAGVTHVQVWLTTAPGAVVEGLVGTVALAAETFTYTGQIQTALLATIPTVNTTGLGAGTNCLHLDDKTVMLHSVGTGTYQLQGSLDNTNWVSEGSALTASSTAPLEVTEAYAYLRWNCTAYTSGTPTSVLAGRDSG